MDVSAEPGCRTGRRAGTGRRRRRTVVVGVVAACTVVLALAPTGLASGTGAAAAIPLGDYAGAGDPGGVAAFARRTGAHLSLGLDFLDGSTWGTIEAAAGVGVWARSGYRLVLAVPMLPDEGRASLRNGAHGAYDGDFVTLARNLVRAGVGNAVLRLGWEFNGTWYRWRVRSGAGALQYAAYFRAIVTSMRSVPGQAFRFVWNPDADRPAGRFSPSQAYPGNAYVDAVGVDLYDESWVADPSPADAWNGYLTSAWGLDWLASFATAVGKPIVLPEWGVAIRSDGHGLGDDPFFVDQVASWITSHDVAWTDVFSFDDQQLDDITDGHFPHALGAFEANFG